MNEKQKQVQILLINIFSELKLDAKYIWSIKERFNTLDMEDSEWSDADLAHQIGKIQDRYVIYDYGLSQAVWKEYYYGC